VGAFVKTIQPFPTGSNSLHDISFTRRWLWYTICLCVQL